jgi:hypothetical protein
MDCWPSFRKSWDKALGYSRRDVSIVIATLSAGIARESGRSSTSGMAFTRMAGGYRMPRFREA